MKKWRDGDKSKLLVSDCFEEDMETVKYPFGAEIRELLVPFARLSKRETFLWRFKQTFGETEQSWEMLSTAFNIAQDGFNSDVEKYKTGRRWDFAMKVTTCNINVYIIQI